MILQHNPVTLNLKRAVKFSFQKNVACSQMTLPIVGALSVLLWYVLPDRSSHGAFTGSEYGIWQFMPDIIVYSRWTREISLAVCALSVYLMAELNNANMLLRVSSRMLSSMLAILLAISLHCHHMHPGLMLMALSLLSFFPLFASYRQPYPQQVFMAFVCISIASLFFPLMIWTGVAYWILTGVMRAFTPRCFVASILAMLLPYWVAAGAAVYFDHMPLFLQHLRQMVTLHIGSYADITPGAAAIAMLTALLFISGSVDFYVNRLLDRTRTRTTLNAVFIHGCTFIIIMALQPQHITMLQPVLLLDTAILFGHFFTLTHTRFSHIYMLLMLALAIITVLLQSGTMCQDAYSSASAFMTGITHSWFN